MNHRVKAFLIHLAGSSVLALLAIALVFWVWYPSPLDKSVGVTAIFLIILGVDVVLGPALTLIVFNPQKKSLRFDLATIVVLQLLAFSYGLWTVAEGRPAWLVFSVDRFDLVQRVDIDRRKLSEAKPEYRDAPWFGPQWVAAASPTDINERSLVTWEAVMGGIGIAQRPHLYRPLMSEADALKRKIRPLNELLQFNSAANVDAVRRQWPMADGWLPMMGRVQPVVVLLEKNAAKVVAVVDLRPWN